MRSSALPPHVRRQLTQVQRPAHGTWESYYRYAAPRFCGRCGEYRESPCMRCTFCRHPDFAIIHWLFK